MRRRILAAVGAIALTLPASAALAASPDDDPSSRFRAAASRGAIDTSFSSAAIGADGRVTVVIEMTGDPVAVVEAENGQELSTGERSAVKNKLKKAQDSIKGSITGKGGEIQAQMQSAYNGFQASVPADQVDAVASLPGVVAIHPVRTYSIDNAVSVPYLGLPAVWQNTGFTGQGVKVAIIDTGIDYTHATFGGPGTAAAYEAAHAAETQPADPALFGPGAPRIKGGIDLVGDSYNADPSSASYQPVPHPDSNPLDCQGHGSHVAGTAGGSGVLADGTGFTGPYDSTTPGNAFRVGPGVAPKADLYAIRVFGCGGSTDMVVPALDWAVENGMDVVNMSLGSSFGRGDDPDAVAAANAVGAGVVVVASAGNAGHNPYLTGSPGTGDGVIAVSAVDSAEGFPGATITVGGQPIEAINANGVSVAGLGTLSVVRLVDDPATPENEALGCSVAAYTKAGVAPGQNQLAVSTRGTCARVAKAIYAQEAGAAAALMVNSSNDLPPFEGAITENADTGEPANVTIPFLGVRSSNGPVFTTGATATFADAQISNPGFRGYGSFTSSGPRSGDSAISPDVAAPGVSIVSAAVGSGNGAVTLSGTSMAAPHVAGVAALSVQAHPSWSAPQVAASVVSTADPEKVAGQSLTIGGVGLVDAAQAVATTVTATGDAFRTESGWARESALSFGFQESPLGFAGIKTVTVRNDGPKSVTYKVSTSPSAQSAKAKVSLSTKSITVRPGSSAKLLLSVTASAKDIPTSVVAGDQFTFYEISGDITLTAKDSTLRVPYLLVPRSTSTVSSPTSALFTGKQKVTDATKKISLWNIFGAQASAGADVYTWGLSNGKDIARTLPDTGYDIRAAGVQSFADGSDHLMVFALNMHHRWSNAASNEYDVILDTDRDGQADWIVLSADSGAVRAGDNNGLSEVFIVNAKTGATAASGFQTQSPTDSSTLLLPVYASDLGITGAFNYTVQTSSVNGGKDSVNGWATYDPTAPAISNGQFVDVPSRGSASVDVAVNAAQVAAQKPLGTMVVVFDNPSGAGEALLVKVK
ncbi:MAG: peptidase S8 and S53 subtilisin kexin sedolisin [Microbacterium sp. SCN 70-27]|uniref:S8 family serine peptidase n=1 Tax=unclassified Microbacterium TaxID=2609290 RepID=UPI00086C748A|nr:MULTISPECIES: S8 family serine peptidase [unclassified Microbacterium]MBN9224389.1 S8 family serine peptidase [Microbacterium sp.]ODT28433.1 MAG: peptidase S8 and S53 subtilisin kexin sedolisin [Microbacterium sp. SCN 70-27]